MSIICSKIYSSSSSSLECSQESYDWSWRGHCRSSERIFRRNNRDMLLDFFRDLSTLPPGSYLESDNGSFEQTFRRFLSCQRGVKAILLSRKKVLKTDVSLTHSMFTCLNYALHYGDALIFFSIIPNSVSHSI